MIFSYRIFRKNYAKEIRVLKNCNEIVFIRFYINYFMDNASSNFFKRENAKLFSGNKIGVKNKIKVT